MRQPITDSPQPQPWKSPRAAVVKSPSAAVKSPMAAASSSILPKGLRAAASSPAVHAAKHARAAPAASQSMEARPASGFAASRPSSAARGRSRLTYHTDDNTQNSADSVAMHTAEHSLHSFPGRSQQSKAGNVAAQPDTADGPSRQAQQGFATSTGILRRSKSTASVQDHALDSERNSKGRARQSSRAASAPLWGHPAAAPHSVTPHAAACLASAKTGRASSLHSHSPPNAKSQNLPTAEQWQLLQQQQQLQQYRLLSTGEAPASDSNLLPAGQYLKSSIKLQQNFGRYICPFVTHINVPEVVHVLLT